MKRNFKTILVGITAVCMCAGLTGCGKETVDLSLTDLARHKSDDPNAVIANWMRNRNTIEYLGIWEQLYNPDFKPTEFEGFRVQAGLNAFTLSPNNGLKRQMLLV